MFSKAKLQIDYNYFVQVLNSLGDKFKVVTEVSKNTYLLTFPVIY